MWTIPKFMYRGIVDHQINKVFSYAKSLSCIIQRFLLPLVRFLEPRIFSQSRNRETSNFRTLFNAEILLNSTLHKSR